MDTLTKETVAKLFGVNADIIESFGIAAVGASTTDGTDTRSVVKDLDPDVLNEGNDGYQVQEGDLIAFKYNGEADGNVAFGFLPEKEFKKRLASLKP